MTMQGQIAAVAIPARGAGKLRMPIKNYGQQIDRHQTFMEQLAEQAPEGKMLVAEARAHAFAGPFPEVATNRKVDVALLTQGDANPFYITLAIMKVNEISRNGILYDEHLVSAIEKQLIGEGGLRGHLGWLNSSDYPVSEVMWVGYLRDEDGVTWAKGYIPPGDTRDETRRRIAVNGKIGTSFYVYAKAEPVEDEDVEPETILLREVDLIWLDLVHAKLASLRMGLWSGFKITQETASTETAGAIPAANVLISDGGVQTAEDHAEAESAAEDDAGREAGEIEADEAEAEVTSTEAEQEAEEDEDLSDNEIDQEVETVADNNTQTQNTTPREATPTEILEAQRETQRVQREANERIALLEAQLKDYTELRKRLGLTRDTEDAINAVQVLQHNLESLRQENHNLLESTIAARIENRVAVANLRELITGMVRAEKPATRADVDRVLEEVLNRQAVVAALKDGVQAAMGPDHVRPQAETATVAQPEVSSQPTFGWIPGARIAGGA